MSEQRRIKLNVGGKHFETTVTTLIYKYPNSLLANMVTGPHKVEPDETGEYFIDRDGTFFGFVLNFLRDDEIELPQTDLQLAQLEREAEYYGIDGLQSLASEHRVKLQQQETEKNKNLNTQIYYPLSSGTGFSQSQGYSYSSGSGFGLDSSVLASSFSTLSIHDNATVVPPTSPEDDPARDLFAPYFSSLQPFMTDAHYYPPVEGPFGPPITFQLEQINFHDNLGPFGPPMTDLLFPDDLPNLTPDLSPLSLSSDLGDDSGF
eukprot:TRINITY_DN1821_c0_g1_i1.p1 TRINITY_DN1821_c0_g1~~TRINITY_DN1821_c0_g1_i1.p1  ORF type:complete len:296 (-),score=80.94 TRINITY_DN1821_c0_g1_i1:184-969(-)